MNQSSSKGIAALLVMLLSIQAPVALAFACADHGSKKVETVTEPVSVADCHGKMTPTTPQAINASDCCDDCACPAAMSVALTSDTVELTLVPVPERISALTILFVSLHPDRILHPPIS